MHIQSCLFDSGASENISHAFAWERLNLWHKQNWVAVYASHTASFPGLLIEWTHAFHEGGKKHFNCMLYWTVVNPGGKQSAPSGNCLTLWELCEDQSLCQHTDLTLSLLNKMSYNSKIFGGSNKFQDLVWLSFCFGFNWAVHAIRQKLCDLPKNAKPTQILLFLRTKAPHAQHIHKRQDSNPAGSQ